MSTYRALFTVGEFRALFGAQAMVAGQTMQMLALSTLVYARTASPLLAAVAYLAGFAPQALGAATLLSLADRVRCVGYAIGRAVCSAALGPRPALLGSVVARAWPHAPRSTRWGCCVSGAARGSSVSGASIARHPWLAATRVPCSATLGPSADCCWRSGCPAA